MLVFESRLSWSLSMLFPSPLLLSPNTGFKALMATPRLYVGAEDLKSSRLVFTANVLTPSDPLHKPYKTLFEFCD